MNYLLDKISQKKYFDKIYIIKIHSILKKKN
jgi:hypothetical protein